MRAEAQAYVDQINDALALLRRFLDWDRALRRLDELNAKVEDQALWNDPKLAQSVMRERRRLDEAIGATRAIESELNDTVELMEMLDRAGPFGAAAPAPRFAFADQLVDSVSTMGDGHLRLRFRSPGAAPVDAVAWGAMAGPLGPALMGAQGHRFHLAGKLELSVWGGRQRLRLRLDDAAEA